MDRDRVAVDAPGFRLDDDPSADDGATDRAVGTEVFGTTPTMIHTP